VKGSALRHELLPSPNHEPRRHAQRPTILLLHYTGMETSAASVRRLCDPSAKVSCHYLVDEAGRIIQLVDEDERAWHAGLACWRGLSDINSASIGIEIQNIGHNGDYPAFGEVQMQSIIALCSDIVARHAISKEMVLAHSDVAPARKADPGEKFDWGRLHEAGIGHWVEPSEATGGLTLAPGDSGGQVLELQRALLDYGYCIAPSGNYDAATQDVVTAFQRHFHPTRIDGIADAATVETLNRLSAALPVGSAGTG
jgi:N-acetylmuramoyl-L-alanine amidase